MKSRPHDFVMLAPPLGAGTIRVECDEDDELGRHVLIETPPFDGALILDASQLREIARTLEHAADWIGEGITIPEAMDA